MLRDKSQLEFENKNEENLAKHSPPIAKVASSPHNGLEPLDLDMAAKEDEVGSDEVPVIRNMSQHIDISPPKRPHIFQLNETIEH